MSLGPVRLAGWAKANGRRDPIVHAKVAVLGYYRNLYVDVEGYEVEVSHFEPTAAWWGSANFTLAARRHVEMATMSTDNEVLSELTRLVMRVLSISEPLGSSAATPTPELIDAACGSPTPTTSSICSRETKDEDHE